jgi:hypothetical protein
MRPRSGNFLIPLHRFENVVLRENAKRLEPSSIEPRRVGTCWINRDRGESMRGTFEGRGANQHWKFFDLFRRYCPQARRTTSLAWLARRRRERGRGPSAKLQIIMMCHCRIPCFSALASLQPPRGNPTYPPASRLLA